MYIPIKISSIMISQYPPQETLSKYLKTVPQFLDKGEFETTVEAVKELGQQGGDGERLQLLLEDKASKSENWVIERICFIIPALLDSHIVNIISGVIQT